MKAVQAVHPVQACASLVPPTSKHHDCCSLDFSQLVCCFSHFLFSLTIFLLNSLALAALKIWYVAESFRGLAKTRSTMTFPAPALTAHPQVSDSIGLG